MLFLPKYGTICVCAAAAAAQPATSTATRRATGEEDRRGNGSRVRISKYLGKVERGSETGCDLTVTAGRLQTPCSAIARVGGPRCPLPTPPSDSFGRQDLYTGPPMRAWKRRPLRRDSLRACLAEARGRRIARRLACQAEARGWQIARRLACQAEARRRRIARRLE